MELTGKIIAALPERSGTSKATGSSWKVQEFVLETQEKFPHKMMFSIFGEDKISQAAIKPGDNVTVSFDINAREFNGRWYNDVRAWKVDHVDVGDPMQGGAPAAAAPTSTPFAPSDEKDDLPF